MAKSAKAKNAPKKGTKKDLPQTPDSTVYKMGAKEYRPRAAHNIVSYGRIEPLLVRAQGATRAELVAKLTYKDAEFAKLTAKDGEAPKLKQEHHNFISYLGKNDNIVVS